MGTRIIGGFGTLLVVVVVASCSFPTANAPSCDGDAELCPHSSTAATSVTCDCRCTIGASEATGVSYEGKVAVCLPPELNGTTASEEERVGLQALGQRDFDQRVFRYCSRQVARFVRSAIRLHSLLRIAACVQPVTCECATEGTQRDSAVCHTGCEEKACDASNCPTVLRTGGRLEVSACACTRVSVCGMVSPPEDGPSMCRDWLTSTKRPEAPTVVID